MLKNIIITKVIKRYIYIYIYTIENQESKINNKTRRQEF